LIESDNEAHVLFLRTVLAVVFDPIFWGGGFRVNHPNLLAEKKRTPKKNRELRKQVPRELVELAGTFTKSESVSALNHLEGVMEVRRHHRCCRRLRPLLVRRLRHRLRYRLQSRWRLRCRCRLPPRQNAPSRKITPHATVE